MTIEKGIAPGADTPEATERKQAGRLSSNTNAGRPCVQYYAGKGVMLQASTVPGNPSGEGGGKRGGISTWSKASRRRMRYSLLTRSMPGAMCFGATLTVPGPVVDLELYKTLFKSWSRAVDKRGWSAIWRCEVQSRGALHWHVILWVHPDAVGAAYPSLVGGPVELIRSVARDEIGFSWWHSLEGLGGFVFDPPERTKGGKVVKHVDSLMDWPGARKRAVDVQDEGNAGNWLRYLQDHATKAKQEQLGENIGRHWGMIGRKRFVVCGPDSIEEFSTKGYFKFLRAYQRLCTPVVQREDALFGRSLGWRPRWGSRGTCQRFSKIETVQRLAAWAIREAPEKPLKMFDPLKFGTRKGAK